jgi:hypothetical protein
MAAMANTRRIALRSAAEALDRNGDRHHLLALLGNAHDGRGASGQRLHHFGIGRAVAARLLVVNRQVAVAEQIEDELLRPLQKVRLVFFHRRQIVAQDLAA